MPDYVRGDNVELTIEVRDKTGALVNADSAPTVTVTDPEGTVKVDAQASTSESTGKYFYDWQSATTDKRGIYTVQWVAVVGGKTDRQNYDLIFVQKWRG